MVDREHDRTLVLEVEIPGFFVSQADIDFAATHEIEEDEELDSEMNCEETVQVVFLYAGDECDPPHMKVLEGRIVKRRTVPR